MSSPISGSSFVFQDVYIQSVGTTAGIVEHQGPLGHYFDKHYPNHYHHHASYEQAEIEMLKDAILICLKKGKVKKEEIDLYFGGDLNNQITACYYYANHLHRPFIGLYSACSTIGLALANASIMIENHNIHSAMACTVSHNATAERQFRFPLELGNQKPMTAQWTVTGAGSVLIAPNKEGPKVKYVTVGKVIDEGIDDGNNMGPAMAPAAVDTIYSYFNDTKDDPNSFDLIITGDLGKIGKQITEDFLKKKGIDISNVYTDCGLKIFNLEEQDVHCGGSGCGCSATVFAGYIYQKLLKKEFNKVMLVSTGALLSPTSTLQKQTIPCVAHAVVIEND